MAVRFGWTEEAALRGLTIEPAKALMIDKRVGSIEVGKDADIVVTTGPIIDPRCLRHAGFDRRQNRV